MNQKAPLALLCALLMVLAVWPTAAHAQRRGRSARIAAPSPAPALVSPAPALVCAPVPPPATTPAAVKVDPLQTLINSGALRSAYNPTLLGYLTEEGKNKLTDKQRTAAIEQLVAGFRENVDVKPAAGVIVAAATLAGLFTTGIVGESLSEGAAQIWKEWVDGAFIIQNAGYKAEAAGFFENCLRTFPYEDLRARCAVGLATGDGEKAFAILMGWLDAKNQDTAIINAALRILGGLSAAEGFPQERRDVAIQELTKRTQGALIEESTLLAVIDGLVRTKDPARAIEPLRQLTKGFLKTEDVKRAAHRGLFLGFKDQETLAALQKELKGGFMKEPKDRIWAVLTLIEGGEPSGFDWALQYVTRKKKGDIDFSDDLVAAVINKGGDQAKAFLSKAIAARKPGEWLTAWMAIQLLELGDDSQIALVRTALATKEWPHTRLRAAVALGRHKDYSGIPVLRSLSDPQGSQGFLKGAVDLLGKNDKPDPDIVRASLAEALAAINHPDVVPILVTLLTDRSDRVRLSAAYALSRMSNLAALDGLAPALEADYGKDEGRSRNPEVHAHLIRALATRFPTEERTQAALKRGSESPIASVKFLSLVEMASTAK